MSGINPLFAGVSIAVLLLPIPSAAALALGLFVAVALKRPADTSRLTQRLLPMSIVGLGAGMNFDRVLEAGRSGLGFTLVGLVITGLLGWGLQRLLKVQAEPAVLITVGTGICGGSAIAAVGPAIQASSVSMSVALGTVFILNSTALLLFPILGRWFGLSQEQFGLWSALAIHDTSSVVGATMAYGARALELGTTVKLARSLWIVPVTFAVGVTWHRLRVGTGGGTSRARIKKPWFIGGFLLMAALVTWLPGASVIGRPLEWLARRALVLVLFWIGLNLSREKLAQVGVRPLVLGVTLWVLVSALTLGQLLYLQAY